MSSTKAIAERVRAFFSSQFRVKFSDPLDCAPFHSHSLSLRELRRRYFEHSDVAIPFHDIRIEIVPGK